MMRSLRKALRPRFLLIGLAAAAGATTVVVSSGGAATDAPPASNPAHPVVDANWIYANDWYNATHFIYKRAGSDGCLVGATSCAFGTQGDSNNLPQNYNGTTIRPGQGNNAYVFPGIGLGAVACRARTLPDELFLVAARTLAGLVRQADLDEGTLYPPLRDIRKISLAIAVSIATKAYAMGLARERRPPNLRRAIDAMMYRP